MDQYKTGIPDGITKEVRDKIWDIAKISCEHGNALMDLISEENYLKIMRMQD